MEALKCPRCGSSDLNQLGPAQYQCPRCGTGFTLSITQSGFVDVVLVQAGNKKTDVVMGLRDATTRENTVKMIDLMTAKQLVDAAPCIVIPHVPLEAGERIKARLEKAGATIDLKPA